MQKLSDANTKVVPIFYTQNQKKSDNLSNGYNTKQENRRNLPQFERMTQNCISEESDFQRHCPGESARVTGESARVLGENARVSG